MTESEQDALLAEVNRRVRRFVEDNDWEAVLSGDAIDSAHQLWVSTRAASRPTADAGATLDARALNALGWLHWVRFQALPDDVDRGDLERAFVFFEMVHKVNPGAVPEPLRDAFRRSTHDAFDVSADRAIFDLTKALVHTDQTRLDAAVEVLRRVLDEVPTEHPAHRRATSSLFSALEARFQRTSSLSDLDDVIGVGTQLIDLTRTDHPDRARVNFKLASATKTRFDLTGTLADLDHAVTLFGQVIDAESHDLDDRAAALTNVGTALFERFQRTGTLADLDRTVESLQHAVSADLDDELNREVTLANLCVALYIRFEWKGDSNDLDRAIRVGTEAVGPYAFGRRARPSSLCSLGSALVIRYNHGGALSDLNRAVALQSQAVEAEVVDDRDRSEYRSALCVALRTRFERTGDLADIGRAVDVGTQAVRDDPDSSAAMSNLGLALRTRFERSGALADIERAVDILSHAVELIPKGDRNRATPLANLGSAFLTKFMRTGTIAELDQAIRLGQEAVDATPTDHHDFAGRLSNLGGAFQIRFGQTGGLADADQSIAAYRRAVNAMHPNHSSAPLFISNLGDALLARARHTMTASDFDRAVDELQRAVRTAPADLPQLCGMLHRLGDAWRGRYDLTRERLDCSRALEAFREAATISSAPPMWRAEAALRWGDAARQANEWSDAVEAYSAAINLLGEVAPRGLPRADQEHHLATLAGIGTTAAATCLQAADLTGTTDLYATSVELFEQGRAVLFAQGLDSRADLAELTLEHPDLAKRYSDLLTELEAETATPIFSTFSGNPDLYEIATAALGRSQEVARQLNLALADIRSKEGFAEFLLPEPLVELLPSPEQGPVVLINVAEIRSDALVLTTDGVRVIRLPGASPLAVGEQVDAFLSALERVQDFSVEWHTRLDAESAISEVLTWLWDNVTGPVLDQLGLTGHPANSVRPRLFWCPSGLLSFLPLHAAGRHLTRFQTPPATVMDRVVSSTIPTIRALQHARRHQIGNRSSTTGEVLRVLVVAMPATPGHTRLPGAEEEARFLTDLIPGRVDVLGLPNGKAATHDAVLDELADHDWVHFSCHGTSDLEHPSAGHLLLADHRDKPLSVLDLARLRLPSPEMAFLSACTTARTGADLPDEPIHLTAACQLAGYTHVIGTLWPVGDNQSVQVTKRLYRSLISGSGDERHPARALHAATLRLRAVYAGQPSRWASHTHTGP